MHCSLFSVTLSHLKKKSCVVFTAGEFGLFPTPCFIASRNVVLTLLPLHSSSEERVELLGYSFMQAATVSGLRQGAMYNVLVSGG